MAVVTKDNEERDDREAEDRDDELAERESREEEADDRPEQAEEPVKGRSQPVARAAAVGVGGGWFHLYKPGQGYWTRMCTGGAIVLLLAYIAQFMYAQMRGYDVSYTTSGIVVGVFVLGSALFFWRLLNKPSIVDFFIATESEMKKVNWTKWKDLVGSTKVVIFFMFMIAAVLFVIDIVFGYFFYFITVLKSKPF
jgi:preprotein translocase SecE subunit